MYNSVLNILVMGLVLRQSLMVISSTGVLLYAKVSPSITKYGSTLYIEMNEVLAHYGCTFENSNLQFNFQL